MKTINLKIKIKDAKTLGRDSLRVKKVTFSEWLIKVKRYLKVRRFNRIIQFISIVFLYVKIDIIEYLAPQKKGIIKK